MADLLQHSFIQIPLNDGHTNSSWNTQTLTIRSTLKQIESDSNNTLQEKYVDRHGRNQVGTQLDRVPLPRTGEAAAAKKVHYDKIMTDRLVMFNDSSSSDSTPKSSQFTNFF